MGVEERAWLAWVAGLAPENDATSPYPGVGPRGIESTQDDAPRTRAPLRAGPSASGRLLVGLGSAMQTRSVEGLRCGPKALAS